MNFDKWFNKQSLLLKALLMLIPGVNWITELLVRGSVALRTKSLLHIVVFALFIFLGWTWIIAVVDFVYLLLKGHLILGK
ncbi:MAG: hypothetical protein IJW96_04640 [Clostridia bacterium]|nr:hypothetical protein [Clostridia bacterium]